MVPGLAEGVWVSEKQGCWCALLSSNPQRVLSSLGSLSSSSGARAPEFLFLFCQSLEKSKGWD